MRTVLHILTRPDDLLAQEIISRQKTQPGLKIEVVDLTGPEPDYAALLEKIFDAHAVESW